MKKNAILLILLLVLGVGAWFSYKHNSRKSTLNKLDLNFSVSDTSSIDRILIEPIIGERADVIRQKNGGWILNGKYKVAPVLMDVLLTTIRNVEMLRPLSTKEGATALESMEKRGRKVSIFVGGNLYKSYRLGDDAPGNKGTYLQLEDGSPYVAYLRGFNGFLSPRYQVSSNEWRDRLLFSSNPSSIRSVEVRYSRMPLESFRLELNGKLSMQAATRFDTAEAASVLGSFRGVYIERFLDRLPKQKRDSLLNAGCEWSLELVDENPALSNKLELYLTSDPDRSLAYLPQTKEWVTIQNRNLYPVMKRRSDLLNP